jgi:hypothetical protein
MALADPQVISAQEKAATAEAEAAKVMRIGSGGEMEEWEDWADDDPRWNDDEDDEDDDDDDEEEEEEEAADGGVDEST